MMIVKTRTAICSKCGQEIDLYNDSHKSVPGTKARAHTTCPASVEIQNLPVASPAEAPPAGHAADGKDGGDTTGRPVFLTLAEVAALLRVSQETIRRQVRSGRLRAKRLPTGRGAGNLLFDQADVLALLQDA